MGIVQAADTSADAWIDSATLAIVVAVIALLGVLVAQTITLINERAKRRDELTRAVRDEVQRLMMPFYDWVEFARHTYPGKAHRHPMRAFRGTVGYGFAGAACDGRTDGGQGATPDGRAHANRWHHDPVDRVPRGREHRQHTASRIHADGLGCVRHRRRLASQASASRGTHGERHARRNECESGSTRSTCGARGRWTRTTNQGSCV